MIRRWDFILVTSVTAFVSFFGIMGNQLINVTTYDPFSEKVVKVYSLGFLKVCHYYRVNRRAEDISYIDFILNEQQYHKYCIPHAKKGLMMDISKSNETLKLDWLTYAQVMGIYTFVFSMVLLLATVYDVYEEAVRIGLICLGMKSYIVPLASFFGLDLGVSTVDPNKKRLEKVESNTQGHLKSKNIFKCTF